MSVAARSISSTLRIRGELTAAVSRSATEAVESHGTRLISPCRGLGTNSKFEVVIPPRILSPAALPLDVCLIDPPRAIARTQMGSDPLLQLRRISLDPTEEIPWARLVAPFS